MNRPAAIMVIAVLAIIFGVAQVLSALPYFDVYDAPALTVFEYEALETGLDISDNWIGAARAVLGGAIVLFGVAALMMAAWAWPLGIVVGGLNVVYTIGVLLAGETAWFMLLTALFGALVVGYFYTDRVRAAFGHETTFWTSTHRPIHA